LLVAPAWLRDMTVAPVCSVVFCGAPLSRRAADIVAALVKAGVQIQAAATPAALAWLDVDSVREATQVEVLVDQRPPDQAKRGGRPDAVVIAPATFNTVNKLVTGIADTYAHSLMCEHLGAGRPLVVVPFVNDQLWGHPTWGHHLDVLRDSGAVLVDPADGGADVRAIPSGEGDAVVEAFSPEWFVAPLQRLLQT
jgi:phosphopantothenoylcysteine synthetase/decarboxylase